MLDNTDLIMENDKLHCVVKDLTDKLKRYENEECCVSACEPAIDRYSYDLLAKEVECLKRVIVNLNIMLYE